MIMKKEVSVGWNRLSFSSNRVKDRGSRKDLAFGKNERVKNVA